MSLISASNDSISISRARMAAACRDDARRVVGIAGPVFATGFLLEAASHWGDPNSRMILQPLLSGLACGALTLLGARLLPRVHYPEVILLVLLWLVMWSIALHLPSLEDRTGASTLVMLAVTVVGTATLIIPLGAAIMALGTTTALYVYAQTIFFGVSDPSAIVAPVLVLMVVTIIQLSRRRAIRNVEELRERVDRDQRQLELMNEQLRNLSITDSLTGVLNRRGFDDRLASEVSSGTRLGEPLSVLLLDVDNFKHYNDEFGHPAGDAALLHTAEALKACCRGSDSVARYGGEEFALILPATDAAGCERMAERTRSAVASLDQLAKPITVSVGAVTAPAAVMTDQDSVGVSLVTMADRALYKAKASGRDRAELVVLPEAQTDSD